jgi:predicted amidophosphoribosyltransferase
MTAHQLSAYPFPELVYKINQYCLADQFGGLVNLFHGTQLSYYRLYRTVWTDLDWIYPPNCGGCDELGARRCEICKSAILHMPAPRCPIWGIPQSEIGLCAACNVNKPQFEKLRSVGVYEGPLRKSLHRLKYRQDIGLRAALARQLADLYLSMDWELDLVVPIPLSKIRKSERGYNRVALLGLPLAMRLQGPYRPHNLSSVVNNKSQVGLTARERKEKSKECVYR